MDCIHLAWALKQVLTQAKENSPEIERKKKRRKEQSFIYRREQNSKVALDK